MDMKQQNAKENPDQGLTVMLKEEIARQENAIKDSDLTELILHQNTCLHRVLLLLLEIS
jgi:hypothetical protein